MAAAEFHLSNQNVLGRPKSFQVIVPESTEGPFPVLYLLHGLSDNHLAWTQFTSIERFVGRLPLIVVMPDGERGFYSNDPDRLYADYEAHIVGDIVGFVDRTFHTVQSPAGRVTAGLSMGGYGAVKFALKYPDLFCAAASLSGAVGFGHEDRDIELLVREFASIVGPKIPGGPADLYKLVSDLPTNRRPALFLTCGVDDFLLNQNRSFDTFLNTIDYQHIYTEHPGSHTWEYWNRHILDALEFLLPFVGIDDYSAARYLSADTLQP